MAIAIHYLGCNFQAGTVYEAAQEILANVDQPFRYVVTPNALDLVRLHAQPSVTGPIYKKAWRVYLDSHVVARLARWSEGYRIPVITGAELTSVLLTKAMLMRLRICIVGGSLEARNTLIRAYPGLDVVVYAPPRGFGGSVHDLNRFAQLVVGAKAHLVFLAIGNPQQAIFAEFIAAHPEAKGVGLCVGAAIDFLTGDQRRAPDWMQGAGLEWLYRLLTQPRRLWRRYLVEAPRIFPIAYRYWKTNRINPWVSNGYIKR